MFITIAHLPEVKRGFSSCQNLATYSIRTRIRSQAWTIAAPDVRILMTSFQSEYFVEAEFLGIVQLPRYTSTYTLLVERIE